MPHHPFIEHGACSRARRATHKLGHAALAGVVTVLAACGGGSDTAQSSPMSSTQRVSAQAAVPQSGTTRADAFRLLTQATFGPTEADVQRVMSTGTAAWVDAQLAMPPRAVHVANWDREEAQWRLTAPANTSAGPKPVFHSFYREALSGEDQLRQRVSYALSQIFVVSQLGLLGPKNQATASFMDMLNRNAFGNYRTLIEDVAMHPAMGLYLSHLGNRKESLVTGLVPDQNFAREVMQLFSIGLVQLRDNGTVKIDGRGRPLETYTAEDIEGMARVFTGFSWAGPDTSNPRFYGADAATDPKHYVLPMQAYNQFHSTTEKRFLGAVIPAQTTADANASLRVALDTLYNHPNVAPFLSKQLIQRLVTSNPSTGYVWRVAAVFKDNGAGQRGDLKAVVRAILLDKEARNASIATEADYGKLREPVLRMTAFLRAFNAQSYTGGYMIENTEDPAFGLAQAPMRSETVFNFYRPAYTAPGTLMSAAGKVVPEMQITSETSNSGYANFMRDAVQKGAGEFIASAQRRDLMPDYTGELALADQPAALVDRVASRLLGENVNTALKSDMQAVVESIALPALKLDRSNQWAVDYSKRNRVYSAVLLAVVSPDFVAQR